MTPNPRRLTSQRRNPVDASGRRFTAGRAAARAIPAPEIPDSVREDMARAADLWQTLHDEGKELRYEIDERAGTVSVELRDLDGEPLRSVSLVRALGAGGDDPTLR